MKNKRLFIFSLLSFFLTLFIILFLGESFASVYFATHNSLKTRQRAILYRETALKNIQFAWNPKRIETSQIVHPFFGYVLNPKLPGVNNFGFESKYDFKLCGNKYCLDTELQNPLTVGIFGGSFAKVVGGESEYLEKKLADIFPERTPVVINFGIGGHAMPQAFFIFSYFKDLLDIGVFLDGLNELLNPIENNAANFPPEYAKAVHFKYKLSLMELTPRNYELTHQISQLKTYSSIITWISLGPIIRYSLMVHYFWVALERYFDLLSQRKMWEIHKSYFKEERFYNVSNEKLLVFGAGKWESYHRLIHKIASSSGILDLHLVQPNPFVPGSKRLTTEEKYLVNRSFPVRWHVTTGYPWLKRHIRRLQKESAIAEDLSMIFAPIEGPIWVDSAHPNERGSTRVLDRVFELIKENKRFISSDGV